MEHCDGQSTIITYEKLRSILRKNFNDDQLDVLNFKTSKLLSVGENFSSEMIKLEVIVCKNESSDQEKLNFVAKTINPTDVISWSDALRKEVFMYTELMPSYKVLQNEIGIENDRSIDILPKYIGHYFGDNDKIDHGSFLMLENLKVSDYYTADRHIGKVRV